MSLKINIWEDIVSTEEIFHFDNSKSKNTRMHIYLW
jgi:hypothetical protein